MRALSAWPAVVRALTSVLGPGAGSAGARASARGCRARRRPGAWTRRSSAATQIRPGRGGHRGCGARPERKHQRSSGGVTVGVDARPRTSLSAGTPPSSTTGTCTVPVTACPPERPWPCLGVPHSQGSFVSSDRDRDRDVQGRGRQVGLGSHAQQPLQQPPATFHAVGCLVAGRQVAWVGRHQGVGDQSRDHAPALVPTPAWSTTGAGGPVRRLPQRAGR
jgi:hypothetical protein